MELTVKTKKVEELLNELKNIDNCLESIALSYNTAAGNMLVNADFIKDINVINDDICCLFVTGKSIIDGHCKFLTTGLEKYMTIEKDIACSASELADFSSKFKNNSASLQNNIDEKNIYMPSMDFCWLDFDVKGRKLRILKDGY